MLLYIKNNKLNYIFTFIMYKCNFNLKIFYFLYIYLEKNIYEKGLK